ncbi:MAG: hypothetical protein ACRC2T_07170 [Thermoguttaceae bacterium]
MKDGEPVEGAFIMFKAIDPENKWQPTGTTNKSGAAKIQTYGDFVGAPAGEYSVLISKMEVSVAPPGVSEEEKIRIEHLPAKVVVDPSFNNPDMTPHHITIPSSGKVDQTFEVTGP